MEVTTEHELATDRAVAPPRFYQVWIDTNLGYSPADWEMNSLAKPYELAEQEAADCYIAGFPALILLDGTTPRSDGLFSNPATD